MVPKHTMDIKNSKLLIFVLGILTSFGPMSIDMYLPAFSSMASDLGVKTGELQYTLTSFFIGLAIGQLIYGPISDKYGRKKPLLFGISLFVLTSFLISQVDSLNTVVALRFMQALGSCVGMVITRAIIRDSFQSKDMAKAFSLILLVMGVSPIFAPLIGSQILLFSNWRGMFIFLVGFGLVAFFLVTFFIKESLKESVSIKNSFSNYFLLLKDKQFIMASIVSGAILGAMFSYIGSSSIVFLDIFDVGEKIYPLLFGLNALGYIIFAQLNIKLLNKYSINTILNKSMWVLFSISLYLLFVTYFDFSVWFFEAGVFFMLASIGLIMPNIVTKALEFQAKRAGVASALMGSLQFLIASPRHSNCCRSFTYETMVYGYRSFNFH